MIIEIICRATFFEVEQRRDKESERDVVFKARVYFEQAHLCAIEIPWAF